MRPVTAAKRRQTVSLLRHMPQIQRNYFKHLLQSNRDIENITTVMITDETLHYFLN